MPPDDLNHEARAAIADYVAQPLVAFVPHTADAVVPKSNDHLVPWRDRGKAILNSYQERTS